MTDYRMASRQAANNIRPYCGTEPDKAWRKYILAKIDELKEEIVDHPDLAAAIAHHITRLREMLQETGLNALPPAPMLKPTGAPPPA